MRGAIIGFLALGAVVMGNLGGCPNMTGPATLTAAQAAAVNAVGSGLDDWAAAFLTLTELNNERLAFVQLEQLAAFGDGCPAVSVARQGDQGLIGFNFSDAGCADSSTAGLTVTGRFQFNVDIAASSASVTFADVTVDGRAVDGTLTFTVTRDAGAVTLTGQIDGELTIDGKTFSGSFTAVVSAAGTLTLDSNGLAMAEGGTSYTATLDDLVVAPADSGNLVPQSGTATVTIDESGQTTTLTIAFSGQTPQTGEVQVSIDGQSAGTHALP